MSVASTNPAGTLDLTGTIITLPVARRAVQLILDDAGAGGVGRVTAINGITQGDATTSGAIPATGIASFLISNAGISSILVVPSNSTMKYFVSPVTYSGT